MFNVHLILHALRLPVHLLIHSNSTCSAFDDDEADLIDSGGAMEQQQQEQRDRTTKLSNKLKVKTLQAVKIVGDVVNPNK